MFHERQEISWPEITVYWSVTLFSLVTKCQCFQCFGETYCLHLQHWKLWQQVSVGHTSIFTRLHCITSQKTVTFISSAVRTWDLSMSSLAVQSLAFQERPYIMKLQLTVSFRINCYVDAVNVFYSEKRWCVVSMERYQTTCVRSQQRRHSVLSQKSHCSCEWQQTCDHSRRQVDNFQSHGGAYHWCCSQRYFTSASLPALKNSQHLVNTIVFCTQLPSHVPTESSVLSDIFVQE